MEYINNLVNTLSSQVGNLIPGIIGALFSLIIGFFIASLVKRITKKMLSKTTLDERLGNELGGNLRIDDFVAKLMYYIVLVYTLLVVLNLLGVTSVLEPLQLMLNNFLGYVPNVIAAIIIGYAGYLIANIASEATGFLSNSIESFTQKNGLKTGTISISKLVKQLVFIFIFIPIMVVALDALNMTAISEPAKEMLQTFMQAIPNILAAAVLIGVFYFVGKYLVSILVELLKNLGLDKLSEEIGLNKIAKNKSVSEIIGKIALFFAMFLAGIAATEKLGLAQVSDIMNDLLLMSGNIFFGIVILIGGLYISNLVVNSLDKNKSTWLKPVVRFASLGLFLAFGLHTMGIAENVVNLAFGLTFGAIAGAFVLSFGLGGREAAGKQMEYLFDKMRKEK